MRHTNRRVSGKREFVVRGGLCSSAVTAATDTVGNGRLWAGKHVFISEKVAQRLMRQEGWTASSEAALVRLLPGEISPAPENVINRYFQAAAPNEKWLTDITEFQIPAGKVYLSPMINCFDGLVISWTIGTRPDAVLVNTMLDAAIETVSNSLDRPVVHSDRGAHYRWLCWLTQMRDAN